MLKKLLLGTVGIALLLTPALASADTLSRLQAQVQALLAQIAALQGQPSSSCVSVTHNLTLGSTDATTGGDVSTWQSYLASQGDLDKTSVTGYFGFATAQATGQLQIAQSIVSSATDPGYGFVGPKTLAAVGCGVRRLILPNPYHFTATPTSGMAPLSVSFSSTYPNAMQADFGDGTLCTSDANNTCSWSHSVEGSFLGFSHTFTANGTYTVKLEDSSGNAITSQTITVSGSNSTHLSSAQIQSIISLLQSFAATSGTIADVQAVLNGQATMQVSTPVTSSQAQSIAALMQSFGANPLLIAQVSSILAPASIPGPQVNFYASPTTVTTGNSSTLYWTASYSGQCGISVIAGTGSGSTLDLTHANDNNAGSSYSKVSTGPLTATSTYELRCAPLTGSTAGYAVADVTIGVGSNVTPQPSSAPTITLTDQTTGATGANITVNPGDMVSATWNAGNGVTTGTASTLVTTDSLECGQSATSFTWQAPDGSLLGATLSGAQPAQQIPACAAGHVTTLTYTVTLPDGRTYPAKAVETISSATTPTPTLSARPNPCSISSGASTCASTISWTAAAGQTVQVWVASPTEAAAQFACTTGSGSLSAPWIPSTGDTFVIYRTNSCATSAINGVFADASINVTGTAPAPAPTPAPTPSNYNFTATPNPCTIASGGSLCSTTLSWAVPVNTATQVWVVAPDAPSPGVLVACFNGPQNASQNITWIQPSMTYTFNLYKTSDCTSNPTSGTPVASVQVSATGPTSSITPTSQVATPVAAIESLLQHAVSVIAGIARH